VAPAAPATEALSDEPLPPAVDGASLPGPAAVLPEPRRPEPAGEPLEESLAVEPARPVRAAPREGADDAGDDEADGASDEPAEPPEPVVSATATGTDATAEPTPSATANAPTRPTYRA
jgi:hypothetical protein